MTSLSLVASITCRAFPISKGLFSLHSRTSPFLKTILLQSWYSSSPKRAFHINDISAKFNSNMSQIETGSQTVFTLFYNNYYQDNCNGNLAYLYDIYTTFRR